MGDKLFTEGHVQELMFSFWNFYVGKIILNILPQPIQKKEREKKIHLLFQERLNPLLRPPLII